MRLKFYSSFMRHISKAKFFTLRKAVVQEIRMGLLSLCLNHARSRDAIMFCKEEFISEAPGSQKTQL